MFEVLANILWDIYRLLLGMLPVINLSLYGVKGDGINDDGAIITDIINSRANGVKDVVIRLDDNKIYKGDITISKAKVTITGRAVINGTLKLHFTTPTYTQIRVEGVAIDNLDRSKPAVSLKNCRSFVFFGCKLMYSSYGFLFEDLGVKKHSGACIIDHCTFYHNNYDLYCDNTTTGYIDYQVMDIQLTNNQMNGTKITSVHLKGADGLLVSGNTMFMGAWDLKESDKTNNIFVSHTNYCRIVNNNLFEAGCESIKINKYRNLVISENNIGWAGQRILSAGIRLSGTLSSDDSRLVNSIVNNNNIDSCSMYGILVESYVYGLEIANNSILFDLGNQFYYGDETYDLNDRKSIKTTSAVSGWLLICNNTYPNSYSDIYITNDNGGVMVVNDRDKDGGLVNRGETKVNITNALSGTSLNSVDNTYSKHDMIIIDSSRTNALEISNIGTAKEYEEITILNLSALVTFAAAGSMKLKNPEVTSFAQNTLKKFKHYNGNWYEI